MTETPTPEQTPGSALARLGDGELDLEGLRAVSHSIGPQLRAGITEAVTQARAARPPFIVEEDRYALVRTLSDAEDTLARIGKAFTDAAKLCTTEAGQELLQARAAEVENGTTPARMIVPWGDQELVLRPKSTPGSTTVDTDSLRGLLARMAAGEWHRDHGQEWAEQHVQVTTDLAAELPAVVEVAETVAGTALETLWRLLASPKVKSTELDSLRRQLAGAGDDRAAALLGGTVSRSSASWDGETVELVREAAKARRR